MSKSRLKIFCAVFVLFLGVLHVQAGIQSDLSLRADPEYFSPNNDSLQDQVFFHPVLRSSQDIQRWALDVLNQRGKLVARLSGPGFPALIKWDGRDKRGNIVLDGRMTGRLRVWGDRFRDSADANFSIDTVPPLAGLSISTPVIDASILEGNAFNFMPVVDDATPLERWQLQILDETGRTLRVFWSSGPEQQVSWDGLDRAGGVMVPPGNYKGVFQAWDKAGNEGLPTFVDFSVQLTPRQILERRLSLIRVTQTPMGLIVQINSKDLYFFRKGRIRLSVQGRNYLKEAALLINSYPDAPVRLDGYCDVYKGKKNRTMSGGYAWVAYKQLIKAGRVVPTRITVRGRAKSPLFDRRSVALPLIRDGIEIILEGDRAW